MNLYYFTNQDVGSHIYKCKFTKEELTERITNILKSDIKTYDFDEIYDNLKKKKIIVIDEDVEGHFYDIYSSTQHIFIVGDDNISIDTNGYSGYFEGCGDTDFDGKYSSIDDVHCDTELRFSEEDIKIIQGKHNYFESSYCKMLGSDARLRGWELKMFLG